MTELFIPTVEQEAIINHERSAFISACPGAGKTRVLVERARKVVNQDRNAKGVAFLSFTRAAIAELEGRLRREGILPSPAFPHFVGTFDSFIWQFFVAPFGTLDTHTKPKLVPDKGTKIIRPYPTARELPLSCFRSDTGQIIPEEARRFGLNAAAIGGMQSHVTAAQGYRTAALGRGELDFADARQVAKVRVADRVLSARLVVALSSRFKEIIVDEAQDCNPEDLDIIKWLKDAGIIVKVICDPHQSIYAFRGGVTDQLMAFKSTFDAADQLTMSGNFRSNDNICKSIVMLRPTDSRAVVDDAKGKHKGDPTHVHVLSYPTAGSVPATIGLRFAELVEVLGVKQSDCPVVAATKQSAANSVGHPNDDEGTQDLTMRLAGAVARFYNSPEAGARKAALEEAHKVILRIQGAQIGGADGKTYHQYLLESELTPDAWRPKVIRLIRSLKQDTTVFADARAWHARAQELLAPYVRPEGGRTIGQLLRWNAGIEAVLSAVPGNGLDARTIHSVKGMEFPGVCVVMTRNTAKGIIDYLETGEAPDSAEDAREIYVGASRAERLLAIAVPNSQSARLVAHLRQLGANVTLVAL